MLRKLTSSWLEIVDILLEKKVDPVLAQEIHIAYHEQNPEDLALEAFVDAYLKENQKKTA